MRIASICSLALVAGIALAGPFGDRDREARMATDAGQRADVAVSVLLMEGVDTDGPFGAAAVSVANEDKDAAKSWKEFANGLRVRAEAEAAPSAQDAVRVAKAIKSSPLYSDKERGASNWLARALSRLPDLLPKFKPPNAPNLAGMSILGPWFTYLMWIALGIGVCVFAYLAIKHLDWKGRLTRKAKAMLEEDEPERTRDEWLEEADRMAAEGRFREAVRCLYLACLLRFDEARVARFDRGQTNWEHLARIQASPKLPLGLDFEPATQAFDHIWYGRRVRGIEDVQRFRSWYSAVSDALKEKAA